MDFSRIGLIILNFIIPAMPEQIFPIYLTLFLLGKSEQISFRKKNIFRLLICAAITSAIAIVLRLNIPFLAESGIIFPMGIIII